MSASRIDTTAELSRLVEARLRRATPFWASEVDTELGGRSVPRVDYMAFVPCWGMSDAGCSGGVEHGRFLFFEVKSCMEDFKSGHGLTFEGDANYLVCERALADELHARMMLPGEAAVLCPDKSRGRLLTAYDSGHRAVRKHPASTLLLLMMRRMTRGRGELGSEALGAGEG